MGCYLAKKNGYDEALKHFNKTLDYAYPPIYSLLNQYLKSSAVIFRKWEVRLFKWEKIELAKQQILFYHCLGKRTKTLYFERKLKKTGVYSKLDCHD